MSPEPGAPSDIDIRIQLRLKDLIDNADLAASLVARGRSAYDTDNMLRLAGESVLIRLGECADRIDKADPGFVADHPELELRKVKDTRNVLAHGYDIVDYDLVWAILETNIPAVAARVSRLLTDYFAVGGASDGSSMAPMKSGTPVT